MVLSPGEKNRLITVVLRKCFFRVGLSQPFCCEWKQTLSQGGDESSDGSCGPLRQFCTKSDARRICYSVEWSFCTQKSGGKICAASLMEYVAHSAHWHRSFETMPFALDRIDKLMHAGVTLYHLGTVKAASAPLERTPGPYVIGVLQRCPEHLIMKCVWAVREFVLVPYHAAWIRCDFPNQIYILLSTVTHS